MSYSSFTVEDFVLDKHFRQWVLSPEAERNLFWKTWLAHHPEKKEVLQEARALILKMPRINYGWNSEVEDALWQSIAQDTQERQQAEEATYTKIIPLHAAAVLNLSPHTPEHKRWGYQTVGSVAATVLLVLSFGMAAYLGSYQRDQEQPQPIVYLTKQTPLGTKARFGLPDGTQVVLNAGSTVRYPEHFTAEERRIDIKGEAFFEVVKDSLRPFRVNTGAIVTEALGTAFNVRYEQQIIEIALIEGKVQVSVDHTGKKEDPIILWPGEQASLEDKKHLLKSTFDTEQVTAWKDGVIFFKGAKEQEVVSTLERWYGIKISTQGKASKPWNFTGRFQDKSLEYVLRSVGYTMDFHFTMEKEEVKIVYS